MTSDYDDSEPKFKISESSRRAHRRNGAAPIGTQDMNHAEVADRFGWSQPSGILSLDARIGQGNAGRLPSRAGLMHSIRRAAEYFGFGLDSLAGWLREDPCRKEALEMVQGGFFVVASEVSSRLEIDHAEAEEMLESLQLRGLLSERDSPDPELDSKAYILSMKGSRALKSLSAPRQAHTA